MKHSRAVKLESTIITFVSAFILALGLLAHSQYALAQADGENAATAASTPVKETAPPPKPVIDTSTKKPVVPSAAVAAPATPTASPSGRAWTLRDSIQAGLNYSPRVHSAREKIVENEEVLRGYYSQLFPTVNGTAAWTVNKDALKGTQPLFSGEQYNRYQVGLSLDQPLYRGGLTTNALRAQKKSLDFLRLSLDISERDETALITRAYYQLLVAQRTVEIEKRIREIQTGLLKTAQSRYRIGREELLSVLQIKTDLALIEPQVVQAENARSLAAANFANLLGIQNEGEIRIQSPVAPLRFRNLENAHLETESRADTPEVRQSALAIEVADATRASLLSVNYPTVDAVASIGRNGFQKGDIFDSDATNYSFGLKLNVPIFSGLSFFHQRAQLASQVEQARISEKQLRDANALQRVQSDQDLDNAKVVLKASEEAQTQANESVRVATRTYSLGTSTYLQVSTSQTRLAQAEIAFEQAQFQMIVELLNYGVAHAIPMKDLLPLFEKSAL